MCSASVVLVTSNKVALGKLMIRMKRSGVGELPVLREKFLCQETELSQKQGIKPLSAKDEEPIIRALKMGF